MTASRDEAVNADGSGAAARDVLSDDAVGVRMVRGGVVRALAFGGGNVLAAVSAVFLLRALGVVDFGRYGTIMALVTIVSGVTDAGLTITGSRDLALKPPGEERRRLLSEILGIRLTSTSIGVACAVGFVAAAGYSPELVLGTVLAGIGIVLAAAQGALLLPLSVELRNTRVAIAETLRHATFMLGVVVLVLADGGVAAFLGLQIVVGGLGLLALPVIAGRGRIVAPSFDLETWRVLLRRTMPVAVASVLSIVYFRIVVIISSLTTSDYEHGLFVTSARVLELIAGLPLLLTGVALPVVTVAARDNPARLRYVLQRMVEVALLLGVLVAVALVFAAEPVLLLLGGEEYRGAAPVLRIHGLVVVTIFLIQAFVTTLVAIERQRAMAYATLVGLVTVVIAALILVPLFGAEGGAMATLIADALLMLAMYYVLRAAGPGRAIRFTFVWRVALAAGGALLPLVLAGVPDAARLALSLAVYSAAAWILRLIPSELLDAVRGRSRAA